MSHDTDKHKSRMQRVKKVVDQRIAQADQDRGVLLVHTGNGKGKSSSAFGMIARALGHDMNVGVVQFIKGQFSTGEQTFFEGIPEVDFQVMGNGFTWETQNRDQDIELTEAGWQKAVEFLTNPAIGLIVLDELNIVLRHQYLALEPVLEVLQNRPENQHVVITGRGAPQALIDIADTVTEMREIKHAFKAGIRAQKGVEL